MSKLILGIDVSKDTLDVNLLAGDSNTHAVFSNDAAGHKCLQGWLKKRDKSKHAHICMEATGMYAFPVAEALHQAGHMVSVVNPLRISAYAKSQLSRNKTDKLDSAVIADFCKTQVPPAWTPPGPEFVELQALVRLLDDLKDIRQAEQNRLASGVRSATVARTLEEHIAYLDEAINQLEKQIKVHIDHHLDLKRQKELLVSIPGIGELTASKLLAEIPNLDLFDHAKELGAYAGLNPKQRISGKMRGRSPISKTGNAHLRRALYMPAIVARRYNPIIHSFCRRLESNGKLPMEIIVAAMRKLLHIAFGVLKNDRPFDPNYEKDHQIVAITP